MAGGLAGSVEAIRPVLEILGTTLTYMGPSGAGHCAKLANQIIVASTIASLSEAFLLCRENGVDLNAARKRSARGFCPKQDSRPAWTQDDRGRLSTRWHGDQPTEGFGRSLQGCFG